MRKSIALLERELAVDGTIVAYEVLTDEWGAEINGDRAFRLDRHRDDTANKVAEVAAVAFS